MADRFRPAYHFAPARNWINDPNGLVHRDGVYHLFFQHNPRGTTWGNMNWGHATSTDLLTWTEHDLAILEGPDEAIYSGSVVVDHRNTSGFGTADRAPFVAMYTSMHDSGLQTQSLAWSLDGFAWTKHDGNPVIDRGSHDFRDPHVIWYDDGEGGGYWVAILVEAADRKTLLYRSDDLRSWTLLSEFAAASAPAIGKWECPDLFPLPVTGAPGETRWVMIVNVNGLPSGSAGLYFVGGFDGIRFTADPVDEDGTTHRWLDHGKDFYAGVTFDNAPDGRRILIAWMNNWAYAREVPTEGWRGAMSLPSELFLVGDAHAPALLRRPVRELGEESRPLFRATRIEVRDQVLTLPAAAWGDVLRIRVRLEADGADFGLIVRAGGDEATVIGYERGSGLLRLDRRRSGRVGFDPRFPSIETAAVPLEDGGLALEVFLDRCSVEVYAQGGRAVITDQVFPAGASTRVALFAARGGLVAHDLEIVELGPLAAAI